MPDRYWVGGTASWDGTAGTKWSATSGGAGGASVPTSADDVFFDANSGAGTVTIATGNTGARSINCTGFTGTITGLPAAAISVAGSVTLSAGMTYTHSGTFTFTGTGTLTTAGKTFSSVTVNAPGSTLTLGDALNIGTIRAITVTQGTFTTANFNVTAGSLESNNTNTRTINLGSSTLNLGGATVVNLAQTTNLTFNAGTSQINAITGGSSIFGTVSGPTPTFYNVAYTSTSGAASGFTILGSSNFNDLTIPAPASTGVTFVNVSAGTTQTINGTLSTTGTAGNRRVWFRSNTYGISANLVVNSAPSLTDADFRDVIVTGTSAPISGTRIGDSRGNSGISFSTPKTVYWNLSAGGNWTSNAWATSPGGSVNTDNFPLVQDTAVISNAGLNSGATVTIDALGFIGTLDMSSRTSTMTLAMTFGPTFYGDYKLGTGVTTTGSAGYLFSGRRLQTITSNGRTLGGGSFNVDSFGGTVTLADALNIGSNTLTVTNGTFDTAGFAVTAGALSSSNFNIRAINLGASIITLSTGGALTFSTSTNLTFNAGTSLINLTSNFPVILGGDGVAFYDVSALSTSLTAALSIQGINTFRNLSITAPSSSGFTNLNLNNNQTITGTLTVSGASAIRRIFVRSSDSGNNPITGTVRTLTVGTLAATDCDFRDITIAGAAAGSSPTRAGDCGGNSGITFPAPKTVYWNLAGSQNWSATGWATSSGGTPAVNNFPLAQDTAVFNNTGAAGTVTIDASWNTGTVDMSARTSAMTFNTSTNNLIVYGSWSSGTGITFTLTFGGVYFMGRGTSTIICNGISFNCQIRFDTFTGTVLFGDAFVHGDRLIQHLSGTVDAQTFNVTCGAYTLSGSASLSMGSGLWTLTSTTYATQLWSMGSTGSFNKGTANILLSDNSTTARTFAGGSAAYNKLTIGGTSSTSTTTITGNNSFTELASTKTVAHTIALGSTTQNFGAWTVTGTVGNVVTLTGTGTSHTITGAATSGIDYLAMGSIGFASNSPGEFYAGANSTGTAGIPVFRTAPPAPRTLYWVGGTGNWGDTARWSTSSGGAGGAALPTSLDNVIFNSASNATAYTATLDVVARCNQLTIAGPASGNLTLASSAVSNSLIVHGNTVFPATGFTRSFSSAIVLSGSTTGKTFTSNGVSFQGLGGGAMVVNGVGASWSMSDALNLGNNDALNLVNGTFSTNNFALTVANITTTSGGSKTLNLGSSTVTMAASSSSIQFGSTATQSNLLTFNAGTSTINVSVVNLGFAGNGKTFYDVSLSSLSFTSTTTVNGSNTFRNLTFGAAPATGVQIINITANQTVTGTLAFTAGTDATRRSFCRSNTIGTTRTITAAAFSGTDVDFRDITITGAAAPVSGTRLGDCKGNSGITFPAGVNKFWNLAGGGNWSSTAWATTSGGTPAVNNFPLAQDTCVFQGTGLNSGATVTIDQSFNIGTVDMSARTTNTMILNVATSTNPAIYGNWINGSGVTITAGAGSPALIFAGRNAQNVTSAGVNFATRFIIESPGGSAVMQDSLTNSAGPFTLTAGTFDAAGYNFTYTSAASFTNTGTSIRTLAIGSGTWTFTTSGGYAADASGLTVTGTGTMTFTSASAKTFVGGGANYSGITLDQGGAGTLTITGNNTFKDITNSYRSTGATTINIGTTTQRLTQFTGRGESTRLLTIQGTSASSPGTLIYTGTGAATTSVVDFLNLVGVRAYPLADTWYAGTNSTNGGTLGWIFAATPAVLPGNGNFFLMFV